MSLIGSMLCFGLPAHEGILADQQRARSLMLSVLCCSKGHLIADAVCLVLLVARAT